VKILKRHLTVANVLSLTALFVALAGSAYAAGKIGPGAVRAQNLGREAVTNPKLKKEAVTSGKIKNNGINSVDLGSGSVINSKIKNGTITGAKLAGGTVTAAKLAKGSVTAGAVAKGAIGSGALAKNAVTANAIGSEAVTAGKIGRESVSAAKIQASLYDQLVRNVTYVNSVASNPNEPNKSVTAICPAGKEAIGGGVRLEGELKEVAVTGSTPYAVGASRTGWSGFAHESGSGPYGDWTVVAFAVCAEL
jgi:hypothetical protein